MDNPHHHYPEEPFIHILVRNVLRQSFFKDKYVDSEMLKRTS